MKSKIIAIVGALSLGYAQAATMSFSNLVNFDTTTNPVVSATGVAVPSGTGFVAVGYFSSLSDILVSASLDTAALNSDFRIFASGTVNGGGNNFAGLYSFGTTTNADTQFNGKSVYTIVGNGATISSSTQLLIVKHTSTFAADPTLTPSAVLSNSSSGNVATVLKGSYGLFTNDFGAGPSQAYSMAIIVPEPSAMLLGAVGALGLLRRRR